jgi:hypothetical protein
LNILEGYDLAALEYNSPQAIHVQVEALKLAFADREAYVGDPVHVDVPVAGLLSRELPPCGVVSSIPTKPGRCIRLVILVRCWLWRPTIDHSY